VLKNKYTERQSVLVNIRKNKVIVQKELGRKQTAFRKIESLIANLIEQDRIRKEREEAQRRKNLAETRPRTQGTTAEQPPPKLPEGAHASAFAQLRGRMQWPVSHGSVQTHFGNQVHPILKTVTQSTGIDIATPEGSSVFAVADGEVALISFIPGFGNVLIINHYNGYRTVYAHLSDIVVSEGQTVSQGTIIARSGDTVVGAILHFELWHDREKQNPEVWLARR
jgi:murein DD-endopeptidase MepM/ murein hydrolase activator NlpD